MARWFVHDGRQPRPPQQASLDLGIEAADADKLAILEMEEDADSEDSKRLGKALKGSPCSSSGSELVDFCRVATGGSGQAARLSQRLGFFDAPPPSPLWALSIDLISERPGRLGTRVVSSIASRHVGCTLSRQHLC